MDGEKGALRGGCKHKRWQQFYRPPWLHCNAGGMLVPSGVIPPTFRVWLIPAVCKQAQSYIQSADVGKAGQLQHVRKMSFSFFFAICDAEEHEGGLV